MQDAAYIALSAVACRPYYVVSECDFVITARLADGRTIDQKLYSQFDRKPGGELPETLLLVHERRR